MWIVFLFISAIVSFTLQNICFKKFNSKFMANPDSYFIFSALYFALVCVIYFAFGLDTSMFTLPAVALGFMFAVSFVSAIFFYMKAMEHGPLGLSFLFFSAGILLPILFGIIVYNQPAPLHNGAGLVLLFAAFYISTRGSKADIADAPQNRGVKRRIFAAKQGSADAAGQEGPQGGADAVARQKDKLHTPVLGGVGYYSKISPVWVKFILLGSVANGIIGIALKLFRMVVDSEAVSEFLFLSFGQAAIIALIIGVALLIKNKRNLSHFRKPSLVLLVLGSAITTAGGNYIMVALTLLVSALLQFPVINGALVITSILASRIVFKEEVTKNQLIAIGVGLAAIVMLSI